MYRWLHLSEHGNEQYLLYEWKRRKENQNWLLCYQFRMSYLFLKFKESKFISLKAIELVEGLNARIQN